MQSLLALFKGVTLRKPVTSQHPKPSQEKKPSSPLCIMDMHRTRRRASLQCSPSLNACAASLELIFGRQQATCPDFSG